MRFFTTPPSNVPYPYVLINANRWKPGLNYLRKHGADICIIDSGIEIFRDPTVFDYPANHEKIIRDLYPLVKPHCKEVMATVPDYCDDYHPKSLWKNEIITNIERTEWNIEYYTRKYPNMNWLIPIQGHYENIDSIGRAISLMYQDEIIDKFDYFAVANLCASKNVQFIRETLKYVKLHLPHKKLHAFGIDVRASMIKDFEGVLESFDSSAWTFPRTTGRASCRNKQERESYFFEYLNKYGLVEARIH